MPLVVNVGLNGKAGRDFQSAGVSVSPVQTCTGSASTPQP